MHLCRSYTSYTLVPSIQCFVYTRPKTGYCGLAFEFLLTLMACMYLFQDICSYLCWDYDASFKYDVVEQHQLCSEAEVGFYFLFAAFN